MDHIPSCAVIISPTVGESTAGRVELPSAYVYRYKEIIGAVTRELISIAVVGPFDANLLEIHHLNEGKFYVCLNTYVPATYLASMDKAVRMGDLTLLLFSINDHEPKPTWYSRLMNKSRNFITNKRSPHVVFTCL